MHHVTVRTLVPLSQSTGVAEGTGAGRHQQVSQSCYKGDALLFWQRKMAKLGRKPVFGPHIRLGDVVRFVTSRDSTLTAADILHNSSHTDTF